MVYHGVFEGHNVIWETYRMTHSPVPITGLHVSVRWNCLNGNVVFSLCFEKLFLGEGNKYVFVPVKTTEKISPKSSLVRQ